ncbi:MAG: hypothetical protein MR938_00830 [Tenericutes bacterium]|nr:hypothetical protein [Mycoplasmatota bacterium]
MNNQDNNKFDGYITIGKSLTESMDKISIPNQQLIDGIGKGLIDAIKPIAEYNLKIAKIYTNEIMKQERMINAMIEPLSKLAKSITEMYEPIINNISSNITRIFEKIDWSQFDLIYKEIALKYLSNGFYPYRNTEIKYEEILNTNSRIKQVKIIKDGIKIDISKNKKELLIIYPQYKREIKEIYQLYTKHNYRLCILSLINLISIINNSQFEYIDFTEKDRVRNKLLEKQIMKDKETNYLLFSQYINDNDLISANVLIQSHRNNPIEYLDIPFNRHAILHGYSKRFGNEANCLRWFSVLFNTMEISIKLIETENS